jgi:hypothetical protein
LKFFLGMSYWAKYATEYLPMTLPSESIRSIVSRGWGITVLYFNNNRNQLQDNSFSFSESKCVARFSGTYWMDSFWLCHVIIYSSHKEIKNVNLILILIQYLIKHEYNHFILKSQLFNGTVILLNMRGVEKYIIIHNTLIKNCIIIHLYMYIIY